MIAVAVVGVVLAVGRLAYQSVQYRRQAASYAAQEAAHRDKAEWAGRMARKGYVSRGQELALRLQASHYAL